MNVRLSILSITVLAPINGILSGTIGSECAFFYWDHTMNQQHLLQTVILLHLPELSKLQSAIFVLITQLTED